MTTAGKEIHRIFKPAENQQAFLKAGLLGFPGSGKSYTSALMAVGVYEKLKAAGSKPGPVMMLDTEAGSDYLIPIFKKAGIPFMVSKSRAFIDLVAGVDEARQEASVLIIDSITHFWKDVLDSYSKAHNRKRLLFQDWGPIKGTWATFTDLYLNSPLHIIMSGRAGYEYDYFTDESGAKTLEKTGTKMKAETDMGYEPSLLIEMVREDRADDKGKVEGRLWDHVAVVLKDRSTALEGMRFINPTFKDFEPAFDFLNLGGKHVGVLTSKDSQVLFEKDSDQNFYEKRKRIEILKEEIQGLLVSAWPGRSSEEVKAKADILQEAFGTRSWVALDEFPIDRLKSGFEFIKSKIAVASAPKPSAPPPAKDNEKAAAKAGRN